MNETTAVQAKPAAESHYFTPEHDILMFNEHAYIKRMTACGFDAQQAEALAAEQGDLLNNLATRVDVDNINASFDKVYMRCNGIDQRFEKVEQSIEELRQEMKQEFTDIRQNMATKEQLEEMRQNMATKEELEEMRQNMATKEELEEMRQNMATKEELEEMRQNMVTKKDLDVAISNAKEDMAKWMVGQLILIVGFIFTLNKFTL